VAFYIKALRGFFLFQGLEMLLKRADVQKPTLPQEVVPVPELGGDVIVRGLGLAARLRMADMFKSMGPEKSWGHMAVLLEPSVLDADGEPLFSVVEWEAFGVEHDAKFWELWNTAWRLSDLDGKEAAKNSTAPTSE
jgi:hypothetical protein